MRRGEYIEPITWRVRWGQSSFLRVAHRRFTVARVNYAARFQEAATTLIHPSGELAAFLPYGEEGVLVHRLDLDAATGMLASQYAPKRYPSTAADI